MCMTSDEKYIITTVVDNIIVTDINTGTRIASLEGVIDNDIVILVQLFDAMDQNVDVFDIY